MTFVLSERDEIDLVVYRRIAWNGTPLSLASGALTHIDAARAGFLRLLDQEPDVVVYGVTSGYGQHADKRFSLAERRAHGTQPPLAPGVSFGPSLPDRVVRGIVLARLANLVSGHAAVSSELAQAVAGMLDGRALPDVPIEGNGMAGEITPLSHLFGSLASSFPLGEKEALALINGAPVAAALAADGALVGAARLELAGDVFALAADALAASWEHYDPALAALWGDEDQAEALTRLVALLAGGAAERRPYQAPVSWRVVPRVLGQGLRARRQLSEVAESALCAVTDNPTYLLPDAAYPNGRVISNGGYHDARVAPALDAVTAVTADLALLADRQVSKLLDGKVSRLPHQLPGGDGYLGTLGFAAAGFAERAREAARASLLPGSEGGGFGQNDVAGVALPAWRRHHEAGHALESALAVLAVVASQAFYVTERSPAPKLAGLLDTVRTAVPPVTAQRALGPEIEGLAETFRARAYPA